MQNPCRRLTPLYEQGFSTSFSFQQETSGSVPPQRERKEAQKEANPREKEREGTENPAGCRFIKRKPAERT
ncbi:hypothetical protein K0M31_000001 [Melipona bicolor]|uniref:Uncharacterized protein n=1 Tax=Melipona bicolor TaxID=60889 RepID=A0AA40GCL9_9HYME|nr:hypothetical protein K0M31_000001 [Melipona bicolor]